MTIKLAKGQLINLTKTASNLSKIEVALGWDPITRVINAGQQKKPGGILAKLFGSSSSPEVEKIDVDIDASVFMLGEDGKMIRDGLVYFGQEESKCKSIHHSGDNRTGDGDGDDETITMDLQKVPSYVQKLVVVINIYDCVKNGQSFGMIENSYIRLLDQSKKELVHYDLTENYNGKTAIYVAEIVRNGSEWEFHAVGEATDEASLSDMRRRYL